MIHIWHSCYTFYIRNQFQNGNQSAILSTVVLICLQKHMQQCHSLFLKKLGFCEILTMHRNLTPKKIEILLSLHLNLLCSYLLCILYDVANLILCQSWYLIISVDFKGTLWIIGVAEGFFIKYIKFPLNPHFVKIYNV